MIDAYDYLQLQPPQTNKNQHTYNIKKMFSAPLLDINKRLTNIILYQAINTPFKKRVFLCIATMPSIVSVPFSVFRG